MAQLLDEERFNQLCRLSEEEGNGFLDEVLATFERDVASSLVQMREHLCVTLAMRACQPPCRTRLTARPFVPVPVCLARPPSAPCPRAGKRIKWMLCAR